MMEEGRPPQTIRNQSYVSFSSNRYSGHAYSNVVQTNIIGPRLTIVKSASEASASHGTTITYYFSITNSGNRDAQAFLYDPLPEGTTLILGSLFVSGLPSPTSHPASGIPLGRVGGGMQVQVQFQVAVVHPPSTGQLTNRAEASYTFESPEGQLVTGKALSNTLVIPVTELTLTINKKVSSSHSFAGDTLTYTVAVVNDQQQTVERLQLLDVLPEGTAFVPGSVRIGEIISPRAHPEQGIEVGPLAAGQSVDISFAVTVLDTAFQDSLSNQAAARFQLGDYVGIAISNQVTVQLWNPRLSVHKSVDAVQATAGDQLRYTIVVRNEGNLAGDVVLTDVLPEGGLYVWGSAEHDGRSLGSVHPGHGIPLGLLEPGAQTTLTFRVTVAEALGSGASEGSGHRACHDTTSLRNQATVRLTYQLPDGRTVVDTVRSNPAVTQLLLPRVDLNAAVHPVVVEPCGMASLNASVTNHGNTAAEVTVYELELEETTLVSGSLRIGQQAAPDPGMGLALGLVQPGETVHFSYQVQVSCHPTLLELKGRLSAVYQYKVNGIRRDRIVYSDPLCLLIGYHEE
jgi:uncharacterized repeat protein (TIGR01451 family)